MSFHNNGGLMWMMLHSFAEKLKADIFISNKTEILDFLKEFYNKELPCEFCKIESINYLDNYGSLSSKEDLKKYLYDFHQVINKKLQKKYYNETILLQYESVNIIDVFSLFNTKCRTESIKTFLTTHNSWFN
jgi:hypothetical protein